MKYIRVWSQSQSFSHLISSVPIFTATISLESNQGEMMLFLVSLSQSQSVWLRVLLLISDPATADKGRAGRQSNLPWDLARIIVTSHLSPLSERHHGGFNMQTIFQYSLLFILNLHTMGFAVFYNTFFGKSMEIRIVNRYKYWSHRLWHFWAS